MFISLKRITTFIIIYNDDNDNHMIMMIVMTIIMTIFSLAIRLLIDY